jgi:hypothetical protein
MISVMVPVYNRPDFVELQYLLIKKYLKEDFEYFLYDNSDRPECTEAFAEISKRLGINYLRIDQGYRAQIGADPSRGAGYSLDYAIDHNIENYNRPCLVLDSDLFLFDYFEVTSKFDEADLWGVGQTESGPNGYVKYYNNQLLLLNVDKLPNLKGYGPFTPDIVEGRFCDCGGRLHNYFKENEIRHRGVNVLHSGHITLENIQNCPDCFIDYFLKEIEICDKYGGDWGCRGFSEIFADKFLHFRAGSNWIGHKNEMVTERTKLLIEFGKGLL